MTNFIKGFTAYFHAFGYISRYNLWGYLLVPAILSLLLGGAIFFTALNMSAVIASSLIDFYPWEFGADTFGKVANILGGTIIAASGLIAFKYIIMIVASPFMSFLSERIETKMYGKKDVPFSIPGIINDLIRGLRIALRNISYELLLTVLLLLLGLVPLIGLASPFLIFLVQAYYAGFGNMDFTLERHFRVRDSVNFVKQNRMLAIGNGTAFVLLLLTGIGFLFALPLGTVAAATEILPMIKAPVEETNDYDFV